MTSARSLAVVDQVHAIALDESAVKAAFGPRRLVLLVGIEGYRDSKFRALEFAGKDADDFKNFLDTHNRVKNDVYLELRNQDATLEGINNALDKLQNLNTSKDDIILIYVSSHGTLAYQNAGKLQRYIVVNDTNFEKVSETGLDVDYLSSRLARFRSSKKALILALCHSGSGKSQLPTALLEEMGTMKTPFFPQPLYQTSSATMVLSASGWGEPAREDKKLKNDIYTHFLLQGLDRYDSNQDGAVSLFEAHEYARSRTYDYTQGQQTPSALVNLQGMDPIILNGKVKNEANPLIFADGEHFRNLELYVDGQLKGSMWRPQLASSGSVKLTLLDPRTPDTPLVDHRVYLKKNHSYSVSSLLIHPPSIGFQLSLYQLPFPRSFDGIAQRDLFAPGFGIVSSNLLGLAIYGAASVHMTTIAQRKDLDYERVDVRLSFRAVRLSLGWNFFPNPATTLSFAGSAERIDVERFISNETVVRPAQRAAITYPLLTSELRYLGILDSGYVGINFSLLPWRSQEFKFDGKGALLPVFASMFSVGYQL
jgi:hypothetical protein